MRTGSYTSNLVQSADRIEQDSDNGIFEDEVRVFTFNLETQTFTFDYRYYYTYENSSYEMVDKIQTNLNLKGTLKSIKPNHFICTFEKGNYTYSEKRQSKDLGQGKSNNIQGKLQFTVQPPDTIHIQKVQFSDKLFRNDNILQKGQSFKRNAEEPEPQPKQMRKIAERTEVPTDKVELIQYLSERIKQAEDALNDTEELLEQETNEREKISKSIESRNQQLEKLYEVDQRGLPEKIKEKLTDILTITVNEKMEAEEVLNEEKIKNYECKQMYNELKWEEKNLGFRLSEQGAKENALQDEITALDQRNAAHDQELKEIEAAFALKKEQKERLENQYLQMKVALERMSDLKSVLNRFFGNEDLFDEKMELKQQKIQRVEVLIPSQDQNARLPSRENKNQTKLKPLNYSKNDDEDFWRGDFGKSKPPH